MKDIFGNTVENGDIVVKGAMMYRDMMMRIGVVTDLEMTINIWPDNPNHSYRIEQFKLKAQTGRENIVSETSRDTENEICSEKFIILEKCKASKHTLIKLDLTKFIKNIK
jgi:hypothetical protein